MKFFKARPKLATLVVALAVMIGAGGAYAAWTYFTGANGTTGGNFATATNGGAAVTIAGAHTKATCSGPGSTCDVAASMTNNTGAAVQINPASSQPAGAVSITSTPAECASHLTLNPSYAGTNVPANATSSSDITMSGLLKVDSTLPVTCSGGSFSVTLALATTP